MVIRHWLVIHLIRWADRGWTASYSAYVRCDKGELPRGWDSFWTFLANRIDHLALPICRRLDPNNRWMGEEMVRHGWWG